MSENHFFDNSFLADAGKRIPAGLGLIVWVNIIFHTQKVKRLLKRIFVVLRLTLDGGILEFCNFTNFLQIIFKFLAE